MISNGSSPLATKDSAEYDGLQGGDSCPTKMPRGVAEDKMQRHESLEQSALGLFQKLADSRGFGVFKGQAGNNRIPLSGSAYFQFGDLRVDTATHHVVVEVESAGGVTNFVKYWYCLADKHLSKHISKPIVLFHIFRQTSGSDYASHLALWDFLWQEMRRAVGNRISAARYTYCDLADLETAIRDFEKSLTTT